MVSLEKGLGGLQILAIIELGIEALGLFLYASQTWVTGNTIIAPMGINICNSRHAFIAPPVNSLKGSDIRIGRFCL